MAGEQETAHDFSKSAESKLGQALSSIDPADVGQAVASFARENPHVALAAAASVGFLLGGGMTPRVLGTLASVLTRGYARKVAIQALHDIVGEQPIRR